MKVSIIKVDGLVSCDGRAVHGLSLSEIADDVWAVHWDTETKTGELEKTGSFTPTGSLDQVIIMPSTTFQRILTRWTWNEFVLQTSPDNINKAKEEVRLIMRVARKLKPEQEDNFAVNSADAFTKQFNQMKIAIAGMGLLVTGISLIVSGIGIMNVMFVSVRERTKEIGLRKAMGATNSDILIQFLSEAIAIAIIGGIAGIMLIRSTLYFLGTAIASFDFGGIEASSIDLQMDLLLTLYTFLVCVFSKRQVRGQLCVCWAL